MNPSRKQKNDEVCSLFWSNLKNEKKKSMALAVQTKPRPQGSDPDTRKNSKLPKASVLHANTILTLDLQQEQSRRTGASSSVVEFSLVDDLRRPFPALSSSSSSSGSPPPLLLQTDVDLFGKFSVQVVDQSVEVL